MKYLLVLIISFLLLSCSENITEIKPHDPNDLYWSKDESPIYIEGRFIVPFNETLTIEAGTVISFQSCDDPNGNYIDEVGWIESFGNIIATGSENDSIRFTSNSDGAWGGIILSNSTGNNFDYCYIENSSYVKDYYEVLKAAIHSINSEINISNCTFLNCRVQSVYADSSSIITANNSTFNKQISYQHSSMYLVAKSESSVYISNCSFSGWYAGIRLYNNNYSIISYSNFNTAHESIYSNETNEDLVIENNHFFNGGNAIFISRNQSQVNILNNSFDGCDEGINLWLTQENYIQGNLFVNCNVGVYSEVTLGDTKIYNSTFINNETCLAGVNLFVYNSIISGNNDYYQQYLGREFLTVTKSLIPFISNFVNITNCIVGDNPLFINSLTDFHLSNNSPCVDYGNNYSDIIINFDLDDNERIQGESIDIGSYEFNQ